MSERARRVMKSRDRERLLDCEQGQSLRREMVRARSLEGLTGEEASEEDARTARGAGKVGEWSEGNEKCASDPCE